MSVVRIQRKGGVVVQDCDIYIGRRCTMGGWNLAQSKWHNPFVVPKNATDEQLTEILTKYSQYVRSSSELWNALPELRGRVLGCWCKPKRCHGDVLLSLLAEFDQRNGGNAASRLGMTADLETTSGNFERMKLSI